MALSDETKSFLTSKTIWGAVVAIVGAALSAFHLDVTGLNGIDGDIITVIGGALAIYGRVTAVKKIN